VSFSKDFLFEFRYIPVVHKLLFTYTVCWDRKPNSWTYNFIEVSVHNLESFQTSGFCMEFLNNREGVWFSISFFSFLLHTVTETVKAVRGCVSLKKYKYHGKALEVTVNSKEENSSDFCLDFVQEFYFDLKRGT
jgi:hypothetical protein